MIKVDRFNSVVQTGMSKVKCPEIKGSIESANKAVQDAIEMTAKRVGDEILAEYNKVTTKLGSDGQKIKTTIGFNEITHETINGANIVTRYERTTPRGTYLVQSDANGQRVYTKCTLPDGRSKELNYENGRVLRPEVFKDRFSIALRGKVINTSEQGSSLYRRCITNTYDNGCSEYIEFNSAGVPERKVITLFNGDRAEHDLQNGTIMYSKGFNDYFNR